MRTPSTIIGTATALPSHVVTQREFIERLPQLFDLDSLRCKAMRTLCENSWIDTRHSVLPLEALGRTGSFEARNQIYAEEAIPLGRRAAVDCLRDVRLSPERVDLLVAVSCTGLTDPPLGPRLARAIGLRPEARTLTINGLGCAGGAGAIARVAEMLAPTEPVALVVAVELSSLSLHGGDLRQANLVSSALFGDGAAAALLTCDPVPTRPGARILGTRSHLFPATVDQMGFELDDDGFHIVLSKEVPSIMGVGLREAVDDLLAEAGRTRSDLAWYALHPGGRKILTGLEQVLELPPGATDAARAVLGRCGNLSSAGVLCVLNERWRGGFGDGDLGLMVSCGPGLAAELVLMQWVVPPG
jgi:alkylresorcinol/alkylpyrone synthase